MNSTLYRAGPIACKLGNAEMDKILHKKVIEHAQSKWALAIKFAPIERDSSL